MAARVFATSLHICMGAAKNPPTVKTTIAMAQTGIKIAKKIGMEMIHRIPNTNLWQQDSELR